MEYQPKSQKDNQDASGKLTSIKRSLEQYPDIPQNVIASKKIKFNHQNVTSDKFRGLHSLRSKALRSSEETQQEILSQIEFETPRIGYSAENLNEQQTEDKKDWSKQSFCNLNNRQKTLEVSNGQNQIIEEGTTIRIEQVDLQSNSKAIEQNLKPMNEQATILAKKPFISIPRLDKETLSDRKASNLEGIAILSLRVIKYISEAYLSSQILNKLQQESFLDLIKKEIENIEHVSLKTKMKFLDTLHAGFSISSYDWLYPGIIYRDIQPDLSRSKLFKPMITHFATSRLFRTIITQSDDLITEGYEIDLTSNIIFFRYLSQQILRYIMNYTHNKKQIHNSFIIQEKMNAQSEKTIKQVRFCVPKVIYFSLYFGKSLSIKDIIQIIQEQCNDLIKKYHPEQFTIVLQDVKECSSNAQQMLKLMAFVNKIKEIWLTKYGIKVLFIFDHFDRFQHQKKTIRKEDYYLGQLNDDDIKTFRQQQAKNLLQISNFLENLTTKKFRTICFTSNIVSVTQFRIKSFQATNQQLKPKQVYPIFYKDMYKIFEGTKCELIDYFMSSINRLVFSKSRINIMDQIHKQFRLGIRKQMYAIILSQQGFFTTPLHIRKALEQFARNRIFDKSKSSFDSLLDKDKIQQAYLKIFTELSETSYFEFKSQKSQILTKRISQLELSTKSEEINYKKQFLVLMQELYFNLRKKIREHTEQDVKDQQEDLIKQQDMQKSSTLQKTSNYNSIQWLDNPFCSKPSRDLMQQNVLKQMFQFDEKLNKFKLLLPPVVICQIISQAIQSLEFWLKELCVSEMQALTPTSLGLRFLQMVLKLLIQGPTRILIKNRQFEVFDYKYNFLSLPNINSKSNNYNFLKMFKERFQKIYSKRQVYQISHLKNLIYLFIPSKTRILLKENTNFRQIKKTNQQLIKRWRDHYSPSIDMCLVFHDLFASQLKIVCYDITLGRDEKEILDKIRQFMKKYFKFMRNQSQIQLQYQKDRTEHKLQVKVNIEYVILTMHKTQIFQSVIQNLSAYEEFDERKNIKLQQDLHEAYLIKVRSKNVDQREVLSSISFESLDTNFKIMTERLNTFCQKALKKIQGIAEEFRKPPDFKEVTSKVPSSDDRADYDFNQNSNSKQTTKTC